MLHYFKQLDQILRGRATHLTALHRGSIQVPALGLVGVLIILGALFGLCMGSFSLIRLWGTPRVHEGWMQMLASAIKVPALFLLTVVVTYPSLYVFNAIVGSRLTAISVMRLIIAALAVMLAVLASFGTILAFFSFTTSSYPFMIVLNVLLFAVSGLIGLVFLLQTLHRLSIAQQLDAALSQAPAPSEPAPAEPMPTETPGEPPAEYTPGPAPLETGALDAVDDRPIAQNVRSLFRIWIIVFALVGAQMSWVLRPFVGNPNQAFTWFRPRESSFFEGFFRALTRLLSGW